MERRKFLIGMGAVAAGGAAAMGTGAFNFANIRREANIAVVDDSNAFLALEDTSDYAEEAGNRLSLTFNDDAGVGGEGINVNSDYSFRKVFRIKNQGSDPVGVWIVDNETDGTNNVLWYAAPGFSNSIEGSSNAVPVDVGSSLDVNVVILNGGVSNGSGDLPTQINIKADKSAGSP